MVKSLSQQVQAFQGVKETVDTFMSSNADEILQNVTQEYLDNNLPALLTTELPKHISPLTDQLSHRLKQVVGNILSNTPFYLQQSPRF